jgi:hypothetical protein
MSNTTHNGGMLNRVEGIGEQQVVTGQVKVNVSSIVALEIVKYILVNTNAGTRKTAILKNLV